MNPPWSFGSKSEVNSWTFIRKPFPRTNKHYMHLSKNKNKHYMYPAALKKILYIFFFSNKIKYTSWSTSQLVQFVGPSIKQYTQFSCLKFSIKVEELIRKYNSTKLFPQYIPFLHAISTKLSLHMCSQLKSRTPRSNGCEFLVICCLNNRYLRKFYGSLSVPISKWVVWNLFALLKLY